MFSYHGNSVIDEGLPEHHVVEIRIHPDLRSYGGIDRNDRDSITSEKNGKDSNRVDSRDDARKSENLIVRFCFSMFTPILTSTGFKVLFDTYWRVPLIVSCRGNKIKKKHIFIKVVAH